jgi:hypothetical protein
MNRQNAGFRIILSSVKYKIKKDDNKRDWKREKERAVRMSRKHQNEMVRPNRT